VPYIRPSGTQHCTVELIRALARSLDLAVPTDDLEPITAELSAQFAAAATLERLDLDAVPPLPDFDPRWRHTPSEEAP
jgi:hypothetical protein